MKVKYVKYFGIVYFVEIDEENRTVVARSFTYRNVLGKAKCNPNEQFREEIGEKIALNRCALKVNQDFIDTTKRAINTLTFNLYDFEYQRDLLEKESKFIVDNHINNLTLVK